MIDILKRLSNNMLVAMYLNRSDYDKFVVGNIISITEEWLLIKHLSPRGEFDGYSIRSVDDVYRVEIGGAYLERIERLSKHNEINSTFPIPNLDGDILINLVNYAMYNECVSVISLDEDATDIVGLITNASNGMIRIKELTEFGHINGETMFPIKEILKICVNDIECMDLNLLYKENKNEKS